ncbi:MAG: hypothetical protein Q9218_004130 [Villophora microphyllina]
MAPPSSSIEHLATPLKTLNGLLEHFQTSLSTISTGTPIAEPPNALSVLHDSSSLLRAQVTKLSLLLLNKPFTPSAIASVITSINGEILPGLMAVHELCQPFVYSQILHRETQTQLRDLVEGLVRLVRQIPKDELETRSLDAKREEILNSTGHVWQTCDRLIKVAGMGIVGLAVEKAKAYYALVKDAVEEIEDWDPDDEENDPFGESDPGSSIDERAKSTTTKAANGVGKNGVINGSNTQNEPLALDNLQITDMHATKDFALKILKLVRMLYPAVLKRRISHFPPFTRTSSTSSLPSAVEIVTVDQIIRHLHRLSEEADELAAALYERDSPEVERRIHVLKALAERSIGGVKHGWAGQEDEFSTWSTKWVQRINEVMASPNR